MSSCPKCGKENPAGRPRCAACGAKIPADDGPGEPPVEGNGTNSPFQALGAVGLKRVRYDEAAPPGATPPEPEPAPQEEKKPKKRLTLPEIPPLDLQGGGGEGEAELPPVHSADDLPARLPPQAEAPPSTGRKPLPSDVLEELVDYASDGVLSGAAQPAPAPPAPAPPEPPASEPLDLPIAPGADPFELEEVTDPGLRLETEPEEPEEPLEVGRMKAAPRSRAAAAVAGYQDRPSAPRAVPEVVLGKRPVAPGAASVSVTSVAADPSVAGLTVGAPPLPPCPDVPDVIRALPAKQPGLLARVGYGLKAPKLMRSQKEVHGYLAANLARLKKQERDFVAALGRAARKHGLAPDEAANLVTAAEREEARMASKASGGGSAGNDAELAQLQERHDSMAARVRQAKKKVAEAEAKLAGLRAREQELQRPPPGQPSEAEMAARVKEYESLRGRAHVAAAELNGFKEAAKAAERPFLRLEEEIARLRAEKGIEEEESAATATAVSSATIEIDEDVGRAVLRSGMVQPPLRGLLSAVETCQSRLRQFEQAHGEQGAELELFDEGRARGGFWMLVLGALGVLLLLVAGGEAVRQIILALEG